MERKYLKLSGDYQGEGTHTLLEIGNEKQSHSAGDYQTSIRDPWGNLKWSIRDSLGKQRRSIWGSLGKQRVGKSIQALLRNKGVKTTVLCGEFTVGNLSMTRAGDNKRVSVI